MRKVMIALTWGLVLLVGLVPGAVWADGIGPGLDLLHTREGSAIQTPIGLIPVMGVPIDPKLGNTDTIVARTGSVPPGEGGAIEAELVALNLMSVAPVQLPGGPMVDVFVTENPDARSLGEVLVTTHDEQTGGGTADAFFDLVTDVRLVDHATGELVQQFTLGPDRIQASGIPWSHRPPPNYPPGVQTGGFVVVGIPCHTGATAAPHCTDPATVPEPATLLFLGAGLTGLGVVAWGRRRSG